MIFTDKQKEALELLHSDTKNVLLYGGSGSGKTFAIVNDIVAMGFQSPGSRQLIGRLHLNHVRASIWDETLPEVLAQYPRESYQLNKSELRVVLNCYPRAVIDLAGFDDDQRIEKILGRGFNRIYLNESSELSYEVVSICKTRLRRKAGNLKHKLIFDCNPPSKLHWTYTMFVEKRDPVTGEDLINPENYKSLRINPIDNLDNLPDSYMAELDTLPELKRLRFRDGEWTLVEGAIYSNFGEENILRRNEQGEYDLPPMEKYSVGIDFGLNMAGALIGWAGDNVYIIDDAGSFNTTTSAFNQSIWSTWQPIVEDSSYVAYCDPAGGERIQEVYNGYKANNSVEPGIDYIRTKIENGQFFVCDRCVGVLSEIYSYHYDNRGKPVKELDHTMDAMRYGVFSEATYNNFSIE